jgi:hypothetical protein
LVKCAAGWYSETPLTFSAQALERGMAEHLADA